MKPIKLKIKGLNSFIDEQVVDFEQLTQKGLFGIFGPTGSGKSTVLDGITLALYGNVARKSSNYINVNCDRAVINFEFSISTDVVYTYIIDREFKRQKKDNSIHAGKCRIVDKNSEEILAEGVKSVNKKVEEILGLTLDDFTRTVVLPQGKFSEFLKLEGKDRREMLERLFNLQKYGDVLSRKLASRIYAEKDNSNILKGQLSGFSDVSQEKLDEKNEELKNICKQVNDLQGELTIIEITFKENEEIYNYTKELILYKEKEKELSKKQQEIYEMSNKVIKGEAASRVIPYLEAFEKNSKEYENIKIEVEALRNVIDILKAKNHEADEAFNAIKNKKDVELPKLVMQEQNVIQALQEDIALKEIIEKIKLLNEKMILLKTKISNDQVEIEKEEKLLRIKNNEIKMNQNNYDSLKIDEEFKQRIQEAIIIEQKLNMVYKNLSSFEKKKNDIENEDKEVIEKGKELRAKLDEKEKKFINLSEELIKVEKNPPCENKDLLKLKEFIVIASEKEKRYKTLNEEIKECEKNIKLLEGNMIPVREKEIELAEKLEKLKEEKDKAIENNLAMQLRANLKEGDMCPVCGSIHHENTVKHQSELIDIKSIDEKIVLVENEMKNISKDLVSNESNIKLLNEKIAKDNEECETIKNEMNGKNLETLEKDLSDMSKKLQEYEKYKDLLKEKVNIIQVQLNTDKGEINTLRAIIKKNRAELESINKEIEEGRKQSDEFKGKLNDLKKETDVSDFKAKNEEIKNNEIKREKLERVLKADRKEAEEIENRKEDLKNDLSSSKEKLVSVESNIESSIKNRDEKIESIRNKVGENDDLNDLLNSVRNQINDIKEKFNDAEKNKLNVEKEFAYNNEKFIAFNTRKDQLDKIIASDDENLKANMKQEGFVTIEEIRGSYIDGKDIKQYKFIIDSYKESVSKVHGNIESLNKKIDGRECSEENYLKLKSALEEKKIIFNEANENKIRVNEEVKDLETKVKELEVILDKEKKLAHEMALLSDLEKLFKGKKFIEFIAANQLKYICIEASKRLKEITHGTYGLEVDENGRFKIRDYKNGGIERDASTLSGGETFLASLALSLALSAQIQLKGTAPLELFFLDEGFGTLDDNLLDVVMNSLEEIHHEKLKIGIISHVEVIKDRIPVKLVVTPAQCGLGGSKVKIETN